MDSYLGEIRTISFNYPPRDWAFCEGQMLSIAEYSALFAIISTTYGGDGRTTFALPNLQGRAPLGVGQSPGLYPVQYGEMGGRDIMTITTAHMPAHSHAAEFTPTYANAGNGSTTADLKVTNGVGDASDPSLAKSIASQVKAGVSTGSSLSTTDATTTITDAVTGIESGGSSMTGGTVAVGNTGGGQAFDNRTPFVGMRYIISLKGMFPPRN